MSCLRHYRLRACFDGVPSVLTKQQRLIFEKVEAFVMENRKAASPSHTRAARLAFKNDFPARERVFIIQLAQELHLNIGWDEYDEEDTNLCTLRFPTPPGAEEVLVDETANGDEGDDDWEDVEDEESRAAVDRVLKKYMKAPVVDPDAEGTFDERHERSVMEKMNEWKRGYYKVRISPVCALTRLTWTRRRNWEYRSTILSSWESSYIDMWKDYNGLCTTTTAASPPGVGSTITTMHPVFQVGLLFHLTCRTPLISCSDLRGVDQMKFEFTLGQPFKPFEQLMGVLPVASKEHIPQAYQDLMYDPNSPILDFYPLEFEQDLNGKKQEWEAIVKIPFIDEKRLLKAMASREHRLTPEERQRNTWGPSLKFFQGTGEPTVYPSSLPGFFPPIYRCTCVMETFNLPVLDGLHLVPGLCDGVFLGAEALAGFPSLKTLPHTAALGYHGVNVHGSESRNKSMVVHIQNPYEGEKTEDIANKFIGQRVFINWPFLQEGKVVAVSDSLFKYEKMAVVPGTPAKVISAPHAFQAQGHWKTKAERIESVYSKRCGVVTGEVEVLLHVRPLKGEQNVCSHVECRSPYR